MFRVSTSNTYISFLRIVLAGNFILQLAHGFHVFPGEVVNIVGEAKFAVQILPVNLSA